MLADTERAQRYRRNRLVLICAAILSLLLILPYYVAPFTVVSLCNYAILALLALSLSLVWGYAGILSFGQPMFFGLGAYAYAIAMLNFGDSIVPVALGVLVPVVFAGLLGYFMFWGKISEVYVAVVTLVTSLILFHSINAMSGADFRVGKVPIGGQNGIPGVPPIHWPGDPASAISNTGLYQVAIILLFGSYLGARALINSHFGRIVVAIRENEARITTLGYDPRTYKLAIYAIGAAIAGLAGVLFANWGTFIGPSVFSMTFAAQILMSVLVGGLGSLSGALLGAVLVQALTSWLGESKVADANLVAGALFMLFVLLIPKGLIPTLAARCTRSNERE